MGPRVNYVYTRVSGHERMTGGVAESRTGVPAEEGEQAVGMGQFKFEPYFFIDMRVFVMRVSIVGVRRGAQRCVYDRRWCRHLLWLSDELQAEFYLTETLGAYRRQKNHEPPRVR